MKMVATAPVGSGLSMFAVTVMLSPSAMLAGVGLPKAMVFSLAGMTISRILAPDSIAQPGGNCPVYSVRTSLNLSSCSAMSSANALIVSRLCTPFANDVFWAMLGSMPPCRLVSPLVSGVASSKSTLTRIASLFCDNGTPAEFFSTTCKPVLSPSGTTTLALSNPTVLPVGKVDSVSETRKV